MWVTRAIYGCCLTFFKLSRMSTKPAQLQRRVWSMLLIFHCYWGCTKGGNDTSIYWSIDTSVEGLLIEEDCASAPCPSVREVCRITKSVWLGKFFQRPSLGMSLTIRFRVTGQSGVRIEAWPRAHAAAMSGLRYPPPTGLLLNMSKLINECLECLIPPKKIIKNTWEKNIIW